MKFKKCRKVTKRARNPTGSATRCLRFVVWSLISVSWSLISESSNASLITFVIRSRSTIFIVWTLIFDLRPFQCFIYHFYAGVRAGGGIGDELKSPYGDDLQVRCWSLIFVVCILIFDLFQYLRMLYDISFFFFVIVILVAIMQGNDFFWISNSKWV